MPQWRTSTERFGPDSSRAVACKAETDGIGRWHPGSSCSGSSAEGNGHPHRALTREDRQRVRPPTIQQHVEEPPMAGACPFALAGLDSDGPGHDGVDVHGYPFSRDVIQQHARHGLLSSPCRACRVRASGWFSARASPGRAGNPQRPPAGCRRSCRPSRRTARCP